MIAVLHIKIRFFKTAVLGTLSINNELHDNDVRNTRPIGSRVSFLAGKRKVNYGFIDDDEFVVLYDLFVSKNLDFLVDSHAPFDLEELDESESFALENKF